MTAGASRAEPTITRQPALAPSPQSRPAPTGRTLIARNAKRGGPFWMPIRGPDPTPIDSVDVLMPAAEVAGELAFAALYGPGFHLPVFAFDEADEVHEF